MQTNHSSKQHAKPEVDIVNAYRRSVKQNPGQTFKSFCAQSGIGEDYDRIVGWCTRHQISVSDIKHGKEKSAEDKSRMFVQIEPSSPSVPRPSILRGLSVTFPDGVSLSLQEAGVEDIITLLEAYKSRLLAQGGGVSCSL